jgi:hypothetical protein
MIAQVHKLSLGVNMNRFLLLAIAIVSIGTVLVGDTYQEPAERLVERNIEYATFDKLEKQTIYNAVTTAGITPLDNVATSTAASYYLPNSFNYPIKLRVQSHGNGTISYTNYALNTGTLVLPNVTATAPCLLDPFGAKVQSGKAYEQIFYSNPGLTFASASGTQAIIIEVWSRSRN